MASPLKGSGYDIIICGGGTAGCVLAARLTESPNLNVLLLEAGENADNDPRISTPGLFPLNLDDPERDWCFMGEASPGLNGRPMAFARGKCLGGSSAINLMALVYPSKASLDVWAEMGNEGWDWDGLKQYYQKFQRVVPPSEEVKKNLGIKNLDPALQGKGGPVVASYPSGVDEIQKAWVDTWKGLGKSLTGDPMAGEYVGGYTSTASVDPEKGERSHAGVAYLAPIMDRPNLHVVTGALIDKIEFDTLSADEKGLAKGVIFTHANNERFTAKARKEVILTAGVFSSSAILERSGIGCKSLCDSLGIKNVVDNPNVGAGLQDHLMCGLSYEARDDIVTADIMRDPAVVQAVLKQYQDSRSGPLAGGGGYAFAYTPLITSMRKGELEELLDTHIPSSTSASKTQQQHEAFVRRVLLSPTEAPASLCMISVQFDGSVLHARDLFTPLKPGNYISLIPQLSHPLSRGAVHITSASATAPPKIEPNFLAHPLDAEVLARHLMQSETFAKSSPFSSLLKEGGRTIPSSLGQGPLTLDWAREIVRAAATSNYHPVGTCAMLPSIAAGGVVDEKLKVHGTANVRVCDASIFPLQVRANVQSTVYAVAEKGADVIKSDLGA